VTLEDLRHRDEPLVTRLDRRPGQKEHRYRHLLTPGAGPMSAEGEPASVTVEKEPTVSVGGASRDDELALLRADVTRLTARVDRIARELGID